MTAAALDRAPIAPHRGAGALTASRVFVARSMRHSMRDGEGWLMAVVLPVMVMLLFTVVFGGAIDAGGGQLGYVDFVVPGIIVLCSGFGASSVAVSVNRDVTGGAMQRFRSLPITAAYCLVGHIAASLLRNLIATAIVIGVAMLMGFRPTAGLLDWLLTAALVLAWILAINVVFAAIGLLASSPEAANGYGFGLLFLPYLSSAFVPIATMPEWMRPIATHQPINPLVESLRALLVGQGAAPVGVSLAWCLGIVVTAAALIVWGFRRTARR